MYRNQLWNFILTIAITWVQKKKQEKPMKSTATHHYLVIRGQDTKFKVKAPRLLPWQLIFPCYREYHDSISWKTQSS